MKAKRTKKPAHPRFDAKQFEVDCIAEESWTAWFAGQPLVLARMLKKLSGSGKRLITGATIREFMAEQKKELFGETTHKDPLRIFQIYHRTLKGHGVITEVEVTD